jgi:hypothetical protein
VKDPVVQEKPGINTPEKAQELPLPGVACGRIEVAENVDYYKIQAKAGQVLAIEVHAARIQDKIHDLQKHIDPLVAVYDLEGREIAAADDGYFADPVLTVTVPKDGSYLVQIRDTKYEGDPRWVYALSITDRPFAIQNFPLGVNPGRSVTAQPIGTATGSGWTIPAVAGLGIQSVSLVRGPDSTNPIPLVVTSVPVVDEVEPNETPSQATRLTLPGGVNGRIQVKRDLDHYVIVGKKGEPIRLEVFARRFGTTLKSPLDAVLDLMTRDGKPLATSDDVNGKDPFLVYSPLVDGEIVVRIRDLNNKGGPDFVYYLEAIPARPDFTIKCDPSKAMIGPGSRTAWYVQVQRTNGFEGPVQVVVEGLPPGMSVNPLTIPANMTQGCLVVSAAKDAKPAVGRIRVIGQSDIKGQDGKMTPLMREAVAVEEIYMPGGGRGRFDAGMLAAAITSPSDLLEVQVSTNKIVLKPGEEITLNVTLKRRADYDKTVTIDVLLRHLNQVFANPLPPGVTMVDGKSKTLTGTGTTGTIVLKATADAPECTDVPIAVQGFVPVNFVVKIGYSSEPIFLSVKK